MGAEEKLGPEASRDEAREKTWWAFFETGVSQFLQSVCVGPSSTSEWLYACTSILLEESLFDCHLTPVEAREGGVSFPEPLQGLCWYKPHLYTSIAAVV